MRVVCFFCNKHCSLVWDYCNDCKASYYLMREHIEGNLIVGHFNIPICNNKFIVHYYCKKQFCRIGYLSIPGKDEIILPINKLLVPLPELEEKVNNLMAFL